MLFPPKWYYAIQTKVKAHLERTYKATALQWQEFGKDRVFECYFVLPGEGLPMSCILVMHSRMNDTFMIFEGQQ